MPIMITTGYLRLILGETERRRLGIDDEDVRKVVLRHDRLCAKTDSIIPDEKGSWCFGWIG